MCYTDICKKQRSAQRYPVIPIPIICLLGPMVIWQASVPCYPWQTPARLPAVHGLAGIGGVGARRHERRQSMFAHRSATPQQRQHREERMITEYCSRLELLRYLSGWRKRPSCRRMGNGHRPERSADHSATFFASRLSGESTSSEIVRNAFNFCKIITTVDIF